MQVIPCIAKPHNVYSMPVHIFRHLASWDQRPHAPKCQTAQKAKVKKGPKSTAETWVHGLIKAVVQEASVPTVADKANLLILTQSADSCLACVPQRVALPDAHPSSWAEAMSVGRGDRYSLGQVVAWLPETVGWGHEKEAWLHFWPGRMSG